MAQVPANENDDGMEYPNLTFDQVPSSQQEQQTTTESNQNNISNGNVNGSVRSNSNSNPNPNPNVNPNVNNDINNDRPSTPRERVDNSQEAIKFISENLSNRFDEQLARKLFDFYTIDSNEEKLDAPDVRKLLLDILEANKWPLVVPDESLDNILYELCLNGKQAISWIEFKSFFVFLQELPLIKLFQIVTKLYTKEQITFSRIIKITPVNTNENQQIEQKENLNQNLIENPNYDRQPWKQVIGEMIPEASAIFIYFLGGGSLLALVVGSFESVLENPVTAEIIMDGISYVAEMNGFDTTKDVFPPIARAGGMKSKVARRIADTYLVAKSWDESNLKVGQKVQVLAKKTEAQLKAFDEKYKVKEKVSEGTKKTVDMIKSFDEQHQISRRVSDTAKNINDKYKISDNIKGTFDTIAANPTIQSLTSKLSLFAKNTIQTVDDISKETKQLVNEKQQNVEADAQNENIENNDNEQQVPQYNEYNANDSNELQDEDEDQNENENGNEDTQMAAMMATV